MKSPDFSPATEILRWQTPLNHYSKSFPISDCIVETLIIAQVFIASILGELWAAKNARAVPGKGVCLPSPHRFSKHKPERSLNNEHEHSDIHIYRSWKKKIPFQQPEGMWVQISKLLRKIEQPTVPRGCILAGILGPPQIHSWEWEAGLIRCLPTDHKPGTQAEMPLLSYGLHQIFQALVTRYHIP